MRTFTIWFLAVLVYLYSKLEVTYNTIKKNYQTDQTDQIVTPGDIKILKFWNNCNISEVRNYTGYGISCKTLLEDINKIDNIDCRDSTLNWYFMISDGISQGIIMADPT